MGRQRSVDLLIRGDRKMFKDKSIFQGIKEFETPMGAIRAKDNGMGWDIYLWSRNNWLFDGSVKTKAEDCEKIYYAYLKFCDKREG